MVPSNFKQNVKENANPWIEKSKEGGDDILQEES